MRATGTAAGRAKKPCERLLAELCVALDGSGKSPKSSRLASCLGTLPLLTLPLPFACEPRRGEAMCISSKSTSSNPSPVLLLKSPKSSSRLSLRRAFFRGDFKGVGAFFCGVRLTGSVPVPLATFYQLPCRPDTIPTAAHENITYSQVRSVNTHTVPPTPSHPSPPSKTPY